MARIVEEIDDPRAVPRPGAQTTDDPGVLKAALASAKEARKLAENERDAAIQGRKHSDNRAVSALEHCARLTQMAGKLCRRILADGGDLGGLEAELERLGVEWTEQQRSPE